MVCARALAAETLHRGNAAEPQSLDPHRAEGLPSQNIQRDLFEGLLAEDAAGSLVPGVARHWRVSDGGTVYTFDLDPRARWSNGEPVRARDFVRAWQRLVDPATGSHYASWLAPVRNAAAVTRGALSPAELGVRALDDHTLQVVLEGPATHFPALLAHPATAPLYGPGLARHGDRFARPGTLVSNGAYRLRAWVPHAYVELERNPWYRLADSTRIERVRYHAIEDVDAELARFRAGELHVTDSVPVARMPWLREHLARELRIAPYLGTYFLGLNLERPPFAGNPGLRLALDLAIDRETLTGKVLATGERPACSWVPPGTAHYVPQVPERCAWAQRRRQDEARRLYRAAGYSRERPLEIEFRYNTSANHRRIALAVAAMWRDVLGVRTRLVNEEWKVFLQNRRAHRIEGVYRADWVADFDDALSFAGVFHSTSGTNDGGYRNAEYDRLVDTATTTGDPDTRQRLLQQAERILLADVPFIPLYFYASKHLVQPSVSGFVDNPLDHHDTRFLDLHPANGRERPTSSRRDP